MKISFLDFWGGFQPQNNFLFHSIRQFREDVSLVDPDESDLIICSVFGDEHKKYSDYKNIIFYTGENIRPDYKTYKKSISFDFSENDSRNLRIPLWYFYIDWYNVKSYGNPEYLIPVEYLYGENEFNIKKKQNFCCSVFSAPQADRIQIMNVLNTYKTVHGYGKIHSNKIPDGERYKMDVISNYKFNICFENSVYPGYFTEKLLHAKVSGSIPIYKSHETMGIDFNPNCCINANQMSYTEILDLVKKIDNDDSIYRRYLEEPLFIKQIDINDVICKINNLI